MIRVKIKQVSAQTHFAFKDFDDDVQANAYIEEMKASEHRGKSEKSWTEKDELGNDVPKHQDAEIEFIKEDVTAEHEAKNQKKLDRKARIDSLKTLDLSKVTTIAQLKPIIAQLIKEVLKDEE